MKMVEGLNKIVTVKVHLIEKTKQNPILVFPGNSTWKKKYN